MVSIALKNDQRFPFTRQPAHCLIIDLTSTEFNSDTIHEISIGISNFFNLICAMASGPCRVPFFALFVMTPYTEIVLPFQRVVKSTSGRIEAAIQEMQKLLNDGCVQKNSSISTKMLEHSLRDASLNFQKIKQNLGSFAKLELTILMSFDANSMESCIAEALSNVNLTDICHVTGLSLVRNLCSSPSKPTQEPDGLVVANPEKDNTIALNGILEVSRLDCDHLSIESTMRDWLVDRNIDREYLHLQFGDEKKMAIKCDIRERLIDIAELPLRQFFEITLDGSGSLASGKNGVKPNCETPIFVLRVTKRVLCSSICESIVFGKPLLLCSSSCWQMEWDELEANQNHFSALCKSLSDNKQALICENITPITAPRRSSTNKKPCGMFTIMASENLDSLLLKSIACREILLTTQVPSRSQWHDVTKTATDNIDRALRAIEFEPEFNPLLASSGLINYLKANTLQNPAGQQREPLRKYPVNHNQAEQTHFSRKPLQQSSYLKPATGKAARFTAPRQTSAFNQQRNSETCENDAPTISLSAKKGRQNKTVTFPDFSKF